MLLAQINFTDLAIAVHDRIEFIDSNGTVTRRAVQEFSNLKALTFDNARNQFVASDMDDRKVNDTILAIELTKNSSDISTLIPYLPDDVQVGNYRKPSSNLM